MSSVNFPHEISEIVQNIVDLLANELYSEVISLAINSRLSFQDIANAISTYGRKIVNHAGRIEKYLDVVKIQNKESWSVNVQLFTAEEGPSDLTLSLTFEKVAEKFIFEIDDLHVL